jgi:PAS domain S-box-containing protein
MKKTTKQTKSKKTAPKQKTTRSKPKPSQASLLKENAELCLRLAKTEKMLKASRKREGTKAQELQEVNEKLQSIEERVASSYEELQAANKEIRATNEELDEAYKNLTIKEAMFEAFFSSTSDGVLIKSLNGNLLEVNDAYCRMSGYSMSELSHMHIYNLRVDKSPREIGSQMEELIKDGTQRYESQHRRKDGSIFEAEVVALYLKIEGGRIVDFVRDISEGKRSEEN